MAEPAPGDRFLDQPFIEEIVYIERVQELLRLLARDAYSPLPRRMRTACANFHRRLTILLRELSNQPDQVAAERAAERTP
jgi:hypothetical protein